MVSRNWSKRGYREPCPVFKAVRGVDLNMVDEAPEVEIPSEINGHGGTTGGRKTSYNRTIFGISIKKLGQ